MTGWIITGSILLFILILLLSRVTVIADYDGDFFLKVKYFGITVYKESEEERSLKKSSEKPPKPKKKKPKKDAEDEVDKKDKKGGKKERERPRTFLGMLLEPFRMLLTGFGRLLKRIFKRVASSLRSDGAQSIGNAAAPTFDELMELLRMVLDSLGKPLKKILKRVAFSHLSFDALCGGDDAAKAAINYGAMNIALGSVLNLIDQFFTLKTPDDLHIDVDFYEEKTVVKLYCEIRLTVGAVLAFVFSLIGRAIKNYLSRRGARRAIKKLTAKPK